jgi:hypothetical protein
MDAWPLYDSGPSEHIHALGVVSVNYNYLEWVLWKFHIYYLRADHSVTSLIFQKTPTNVRLQVLGQLAVRTVTDPEMRNHIKHFIKGYDRCANNRGILMHSQLLAGRESNDIFPATKLSKKTGKLASYEFTLSDIRRVADEIHEWAEYGNQTVTYDFLRSRRAKRGGAPPTLPKNPSYQDVWRRCFLPVAKALNAHIDHLGRNFDFRFGRASPFRFGG